MQFFSHLVQKEDMFLIVTFDIIPFPVDFFLRFSHSSIFFVNSSLTPAA